MGAGFANIWKRGFFAWEYKGHKKDLRAAHRQLLDYKDSLGNPPLLIVSDLGGSSPHQLHRPQPGSDHDHAR